MQQNLEDIKISLKFTNEKRKMCICTHDDAKQEGFVYKESGDLSGGMQHNTEPNKDTKEIKALMTLFSDAIDENELKKRLEENNGNVVLVIEQLTSKLMRREVYIFFTFLIQTSNYRDIVYVLPKRVKKRNTAKKLKKKTEKVKKGEDNENVGEIKPGINLQVYCNNKKCLASKGKLLVWISLEFIEISLTPDKIIFEFIKVMFYNSDHSIHAIGDVKTVESNNYQCTYIITSGLSYELKAKKIYHKY
ncbi:hypothetical protein RFI_34682 [Reticulomyxa filosa]|uniref:Uncharacterized protein n=1 Tax=Reticulomyxa filosa TaxID=46433 RepID=X6LMX3_RETFI|nr:hypothetical protein RFI_34682 [Reticulomyxa filosa]|eukprot:ETO02731.1 hypothetical protein RFI_34682 [Reticulomyxa filosa]